MHGNLLITANGATDGAPRRSAIVATLGVLALTAGALAQGVPDYDFDWITIGDPGNPAYDRDDPFFRVLGRGSVDYNYRISKLENTTTQWMEFVNTFSTQSDDFDIANFGRPAHWGAIEDGSYNGPGIRWKLDPSIPFADMLPVVGLTWREGALYANWLHNGKQGTFESLETGAYDTSTWGDGDGRTFTDDPTHLPGAKFWIPTMDEWIKAAHYDPDKNGGEGGWWLQPNGTDEPVPPDETSAGHGDDGAGGVWLRWPLAMFPDTQSPWGLLDVSGGGAEWSEEIFFEDMPEERAIHGSWVTTNDLYEMADRIYTMGSSDPRGYFIWTGFRMASAVPSPGAVWVLGLGWIAGTLTRRRSGCTD